MPKLEQKIREALRTYKSKTCEICDNFQHTKTDIKTYNKRLSIAEKVAIKEIKNLLEDK